MFGSFDQAHRRRPVETTRGVWQGGFRAGVGRNAELISRGFYFLPGSSDPYLSFIFASPTRST